MEHDRYQKSHGLFIVGLLSLIFSLSLLALSFYIMPSLIFGWHYNTPAFIVNLVEWLQYTYNYTAAGAAKAVFWVVFVSALFFAVLAYICSNQIDNEIYKVELESKKQTKTEKNTTQDDKEGLSLTLKILFFALLIFGAAALFEWFIYTPPPAQFTINPDANDS